MTIYSKIDHLPDIGERICVFHGDTQAILATVISMAECQSLEPGLFGQEKQAFTYSPSDTIRAWKYDRPHNGRIAGFCIMQFRDSSHPLGAEYNRNICQPVKGSC